MLALVLFYVVIMNETKGHDYSGCLNPRLSFSTEGTALMIFGFIVFAPCWVKLRSCQDFNTNWLNWLTIAGIVAGLLFFGCGLYFFLGSAQFVCENAQGTQFAFVHVLLGVVAKVVLLWPV